MTASQPLTTTRPRSRFIAILVYTLRSCFPRKRWLAVLVPCAGALLFGLLAHAVHAPERSFARVTANPLPVPPPGSFARVAVGAFHGSAQRSFARVAADGIYGLVVPIVALVIGDSVLGAEVRAGTFHFTWLSPVPTWQIVLGRWTGGSIVSLVTIAPACALAAILAGSPASAVPAFVAAAVGGIAYVGFFVAIAVLTRRTAVWSLALVFLVERLLGSALTGIAQLSPTWESRAIFLGYLAHVPNGIVRHGIPVAGAAIVRLVIVTIVVLAVAIWRMSHMRMTGASD